MERWLSMQKKNWDFSEYKDKICVCYSVIGRGKNRSGKLRKKEGRKERKKRREDSNVGKLWSGKKNIKAYSGE